MVIGAGLGGLTAAVALLRAGRSVRIYEQSPTLGEVGAGISISPGAGRGLCGLGLESALLQASLPVPDVAFAHYATGELLAGTPDATAPADRGFNTPRHFHRADLHSVLLAAVRAIDPDAVVPGKRLIEVEQDGEGVRVRFEDGGVAQASVLIGADGVRSAVRQRLFDTQPPEFAGQIAFRCLIPYAQAAPYLTRGAAVVSIGAGRIFHRYLLRERTLLNVIGIAQNDRWSEEGWNTPATVAEFRAAFEGFNPDVMGLIGCAPAETLIKWGLFVRPPLATWSAGRVVLLGDAAHPILPFLGLGAALAIEDGLVLARALGLTDAPDAAFRAYKAARVERVERVRTQTVRQGQIIQATDPDRSSLAVSPSQDTALFDYDPTTVPLHV